MFSSSIQISARPTNPWNNHVSTEDTIGQMNRIVDATWRGAEVSAACNQALEGVQVRTDKDIAEAIWNYIHSRVRFVTDETSMQYMGIPVDNPTKELLISPPTLLRMPEPQGDCDDFSMLCKAMCLRCGLRCSFITIKADRSQPKVWSHVYCKVYLENGKSMAMDCSHGTFPGWETNQGWEKREWA